MLDSTEFTGTDRYEVRECLGRGGMGTVFRALDRDTGGEVALKVLDSQAPDGLLRFKQEFRAVQAMRHRNLVRLGELGENQGLWFYTMELVLGDDLLTAVARPAHGDGHPTEALFDEARLRALLPQLATGLMELHAAGKVHRDIKPSNILVTDDDRLVLLDFGMIYDVERGERVTGSGVVVGTGAYMAPEQAHSTTDTPGPPADWYAVGAILYELLAGRLPWEGSLLEVLMHKQGGAPARPSTLAPAVPPDLELLCMALLEPDPAARPGGEQVLAALGVARAVSSQASAPDTGEVFVGRAPEMRTIIDTARTLTGPTTIMLEGHSGVGKTTIVGRAIQLLRDDSSATVILSGRCYERESVPFKGFDGVLDSLTGWLRGMGDDVVRELLPDTIAYLPLVFPSLRGVPAVAAIPPVDTFGLGQRELRIRVFDGLAELITRLAESQPVVLHIDDTQWATDDTWAILEGLVRSPHRPRVLILLTRRPLLEDDDPARVLDPIDRIEVASLPVAEARELARLILEARGGDVRLADGIARDAEGHPMFIRQLAAFLSQGTTEHLMSLDDIIRLQADDLPDDARRALEVVCVAGVPLDQRTVALACGARMADFLTDVVPRLTDAHMVRTEGTRASDTIEHYHDRVRESVIASLDEHALVRVHGQLAHALEQSGAAEANPLLAVHHLLAAGRTRHAAQRAIESAYRAADRLAFDRAAELLQLALSLEVLEGQRAHEVTEVLATSLVNAGRGPAAADVYLQLAAVARTAFERLERKRQAAEQLLFSGHVERGLVALGDVLAEVGERLPETRGRALWALLRERARLRLRGLRWSPRDAGDVRPRERELLELYSAIAIGLSLVDHIRAANYMARHLRLALRVGDVDQVVRALAVEGVYCSSQLMRRRARAICAKVERLAAESTEPHTRAYAAFARAAPAFFIDNDWRTAHDFMVDAEGHVRDGAKSTGWESDTAQAYQCFTRMYLGELRGLAARVDRWVGEARRRGSQYGVVSLRARVVVPRLAADQPHRARVELSEALDGWLPWHERFLVQHYYALHSECELALYDREPERGWDAHARQHAALERSMLLRVPMVRAELEFALARLALARAALRKGSEREEMLRQAHAHARALARHPLPAPQSWAPLVEASATWIRGEREPALDQLGRAAAGLRDSACFLYARAAELAHGRILGGTAGKLEVDEVNDWSAFNEIADFDRMAHMIAPGWFDG